MLQKSSIGRVGRGLFLVAVILLPLSGAHGQTQPGFDEKEAERQQQLLEEQKRAGEAAAQVTDEDTALTYADVLKDPDNTNLNFRYAKAQVARGNVRGAAATLERILLVSPNLAQVRLVYAIVLFRLDNIEESERELKSLKKLKMAASLEAEIDKYLKSIERRRQSVTGKVTASIGVKRDSNINSAPRDGQVLAAGFPFSPLGRAQKQADFAMLGLVSADVTKDLGKQSRDSLTLSGSYFHNEQMAIDSQDLQAGTAGVALKLNFENFTMTPKVSYTNLRLSREKFFSGYGAEVLFERRNFLPNFGGIDGYFSLGFDEERFHAIFENSLGPERDGTRMEAVAGLKKALSPTQFLDGSFTFTRLLPHEKSFNGYRGYKAAVTHTWLLGGGHFLLTDLSYTSNLYKEPDPAVTSLFTRHDTKKIFRLTYGSPLSNFLSEAHFGTTASKKYYDFLKQWTWTVTGEFVEQGSNTINFSYQNRRAQTMLTRTWEF